MSKKSWQSASQWLVVLLVFLGNSLYAESWQSREFLQSLDESGPSYQFSFMEAGLKSVSKFEFNDDHTNHFKAFSNTINFSNSIQDSSRRIRRWNHMSNIDLGIVFHESLHAYIENVAKADPSLRYIPDWFKMRGENLYTDLPSSKARVALEEAYAVFIGEVITSYRFIESNIDRAYDDLHEDLEYCERIVQVHERIWKGTWDREVQGYYYREDIDEYWSDQISYYWDVIRGETPDRVPFEPIFVEESITTADKRWISHVLFESRWSEDTVESLQSLHAELPCVAPEEIN